MTSTIETTDIETTEQTTFVVDPVPTSIQGYSFFAFLVLGFVGYFFWSAALDLGVFNLLGVIAGFITAGAGAFVIERVLRWVIVSNRRLELADGFLRLRFGEKVVRELDLSQSINVTAWYFITRRQSRVPKGSYVVAVAFEYDDLYIPVYALMSQDAFNDLSVMRIFSHLSGKRRDYLPDKQDLRSAGEENRLITTETVRSIDGVEMSTPDFERLILLLQERYPAWMP